MLTTSIILANYMIISEIQLHCAVTQMTYAKLHTTSIFTANETASINISYIKKH